MNIAIIDDISTDAEALKNIAVSYFEKKQIRAEICHFFSAEEFFEDYQPGKFQILFLDIYMNGMTGMEAARRIRRQSDDCILVFVTTSSDFAVESYDVGASYYLLKPFQPEKLCSILDSFQSRHLLASRYIEVVSDRIPIRVPLRSILYADTFRNAVCLHTDAGPVRSYLTFHKFEEQIRDCPNFLSCYRGCTDPLRRNKTGFFSGKHSGQGIGTASIMEIAARYGGFADFQSENGIFKAEIFLHLTQRDTEDKLCG